MKIEPALDLQYNFAALCIAILREDIATPEQAFAVLEGKEIRTAYNDKDTLDMISMKDQGLCYQEIGEMYGIGGDAVFGRIKRYKKRTNSDCNLKRSAVK